MVINKKGSLLHQVITQFILIGLIFGLFFMATVGRLNSNAVKQQVLEKELALLVDSAMPGMTFIVQKENTNGIINNLEIRTGRIFVYVGSQTFSKGYPYFTKYKVSVEVNQTKEEKKYLVKVR